MLGSLLSLSADVPTQQIARSREFVDYFVFSNAGEGEINLGTGIQFVSVAKKQQKFVFFSSARGKFST